jgi:acyl-CoA synthetase (AMP-forming)/AMP-acid ligase II
MASPAFEQIDVSSIRVAGTGAARMTAEAVGELRRRLGVPVVVRYTSTEASLGTGTTLESSDDAVATTVGRPVPGVEMALVDDDDQPVADGEVGRVLLRSGAVMRGYWGRGPGRGRTVAELLDPEATAAVLSEDGWLRTGDFGLRTAEGNLALVGRAHERYIRGGYNVYPAEVEEALAAHPAVGRVAVVGVPDDVLGEVGVAVVVPSGSGEVSLEALRLYCKGLLSDYKAPDAVVLVDELPVTPMLKVDPVALAEIGTRAAAEERARRAAAKGR